MGLKDEIERHERIKSGTEIVIDFIKREIEHRDAWKAEYAEKVKAIGDEHGSFNPDDMGL